MATLTDPTFLLVHLRLAVLIEGEKQPDLWWPNSGPITPRPTGFNSPFYEVRSAVDAWRNLKTPKTVVSLPK